MPWSLFRSLSSTGSVANSMSTNTANMSDDVSDQPPLQQIVKQNMKMIAAVLFILAFALPASSQAITSTADEDGTHPAILTAQSKPANSLPVVVTWLLRAAEDADRTRPQQLRQRHSRLYPQSDTSSVMGR
jgi:hypothetical protein